MTGKRYLSYTLGIETPEDGIDAETLAEIDEDAQPHDLTPEARIARWIGHLVGDIESRMADDLPEGWRVSVIQND
jgi:hypothetical protein